MIGGRCSRGATESGRLPAVSTVAAEKCCSAGNCTFGSIRVIEHAPTVAGRRLKADSAIDRSRILCSAGFLLPTISSRSMRSMVLGFLEPTLHSLRPACIVDHQARGASEEVNRPFARLLARVGKTEQADHQEEKWIPESRSPEPATSTTTSSASSTTPCTGPRTARYTWRTPRPPTEASSPPSSKKHKRYTRRWPSRRKGLWASGVPPRRI